MLPAVRGLRERSRPGAAREHFFRGRDGFQNFQNDRVRGKGCDQVAEQQALVDLDEGLVIAERIGEREFGECIRDDGCRRLIAVDETGEITVFGASAAKKQLIREQLLAAVEDRLAAKENFRRVGVGHGCSLERGF